MCSCLFEERLQYECLGCDHFDVFKGPVLGGEILKEEENVLKMQGLEMRGPRSKKDCNDKEIKGGESVIF